MMRSLIATKVFACIDIDSFEAFGNVFLLGPLFQTKESAEAFCHRRGFPEQSVKCLDMYAIDIDYLHRQRERNSDARNKPKQ